MIPLTPFPYRKKLIFKNKLLLKISQRMAANKDGIIRSSRSNFCVENFGYALLGKVVRPYMLKLSIKETLLPEIYLNIFTL